MERAGSSTTTAAPYGSVVEATTPGCQRLAAAAMAVILLGISLTIGLIVIATLFILMAR